MRRLVVALLLAVTILSNLVPVEARECVKRGGSQSKVLWKHAEGHFKRVRFNSDGKSVWSEVDKEGKITSIFVEKFKEPSGGIVIHNSERNVDILLRPDIAALRTPKNEGPVAQDGDFSVLYHGGWINILDCTDGMSS